MCYCTPSIRSITCGRLDCLPGKQGTSNGTTNIQSLTNDYKPQTSAPIPTVGRIVYYKSYGTPGGEYPSVDRAAIITNVHPIVSEMNPLYPVDLCVLNPTGMFFNQRVIQGPDPGQWDWMPYQKQQEVKKATAGTPDEVRLTQLYQYIDSLKGVDGMQRYVDQAAKEAQKIIGLI